MPRSSELLIRRPALGDAPACRALRLRTFRDHPEAFTPSFWGVFPPDARLPAGRLVGCVGLAPEQRLKTHCKTVLLGMLAAPKQARRGLGGALLDALLAKVRASDLELRVLAVTGGNHSAARLCLKAGFASHGIEPDAIKIGTWRFDENHLFLQLHAH